MASLPGIYLHFPFCESKCHYCNFASNAYPEALIEPYVQALSQEIQQYRSLLRQVKVDPRQLTAAPVDSVYLGGGTPSFIPAKHILDLNHLLREVFDLAPDPEVTLEVNPGSVDREKLDYYSEAGVNRVSIGAQAFQDRLLRQMGRRHTVEDTCKTLELLRQAGIRNVSLDLMAGLPGQTMEDWSESLRSVLLLAPQHVSMYLLELHEHTVFGKIYDPSSRAVSRNLPADMPDSLPTEDAVEQFYFEAVRRLSEDGYVQYEISNFARPGFQSRHNVKYWTDQPFLGFGCGAFSYLGAHRWGNERDAELYIERIRQAGSAVDFLHELTPEEREEEAFFLGLRLTQGVNSSQLQTKFGFDLQSRYKTQIERLTEAGLIELSNDCLRLTPRGWMLSNEVFTEFLR